MTATSTTSAPTDLRPIFLTGFMGTGKSSVGRLLAKRLGRRFIDLDETVVAAAGMPITEIFARDGEAAFRALEGQALQEVSRQQAIVVATGGGVVIDPNNRALMRGSGFIVNLTASVEAISDRLAEDDTRPLLRQDNSLTRIRSMLVQRESSYADANLRVDTSGRSMDDIVNEILVKLNLPCDGAIHV